MTTETDEVRNEAANHRIAEHFFSDASERLGYQHDFAQAAFKTLILVNGGAIVAMLTYAGNVMKGDGASSLKGALIWYCAGLISTLLANIAAYLSQGAIMDYSWDQAKRLIGATNPNPSPNAARNGMVLVWVSIGFAAASLGGFIGGSFSALSAIAK